MEGKKYLDAASGAVTANIGHGVTEIIEAMQEQAKKGLVCVPFTVYQ